MWTFVFFRCLYLLIINIFSLVSSWMEMWILRTEVYCGQICLYLSKLFLHIFRDWIGRKMISFSRSLAIVQRLLLWWKLLDFFQIFSGGWMACFRQKAFIMEFKRLLCWNIDPLFCEDDRLKILYLSLIIIFFMRRKVKLAC